MDEDATALLNDLVMISHVAVVLSIAGKMAIAEQQTLANAIHVWAAYIRNRKNKSHTAMAVGRSRLSVRRIVRLIESDESPIPETVRRVLLRDPIRPSFAEIVADLSHGTCDLEEIDADVPAFDRRNSKRHPHGGLGYPITLAATRSIAGCRFAREAPSRSVRRQKAP